jgi:predicted regulator of Ras-like GTPase activity (Roadblock/LC7/MglB family)
MRAVEPWVESALENFLLESEARLVVILTRSGQVVAQHGFDRSGDLMSAASLAAGIMAAGAELSRLLETTAPRELAYEGEELGIYLASIELPGRTWTGLVGYGKETSLGLVQLFFAEMASELGRIAPPPPPKGFPTVLDRDFEAELDRSLRSLFGR